ncbi:hypothetical protein [Apilactobacillus ozensis]|uniref:hypothetical protein n=1 Tax=Apilactobacillus ozensis TaxID=866801 RepID=UPI00200B7269|nr:hypothetical protein [Apilactobacillus ozensis]MCK8607160.1 hypothetical protein [Apilactobacillus ozensis]
MNYTRFILKSILKNKINLLILTVIPILSILFLYINNNAQKSDNIGYYANRDYNFNKKAIKYMSLHKNKFNANELDAIPSYIYSQKTNYKILQSIKSDNWAKAYDNQKKLNNYMNAEGTPGWEVHILKRNNMLMDYLNKHNIKNPESESYPTHNLTFNVWINNFIVPVTLSIIAIFIASNLFCNDYRKGIHIGRLLTTSLNEQFIIQISISSIFLYAYYLLVNLFNIIISSESIGTIGFNYPYYVHQNGSMGYIDLSKIYSSMYPMQLINIIFIVSFIYLISRFTKKKINTIFFSLFLIIAPSILVNIYYMPKIIYKYIPGTYLDTVGIVSGNSAKILNNVSTHTGIIVVLIYTTIIWMIIIFKNLVEERRNTL